MNKNHISNQFPEEWVLKSDKQIMLEQQGCRFKGQELLDDHELDPDKECYCGRPNKIDQLIER